MSKEYAKELGFTIGEKVLYPHYHPYVVFMEVVTVKDVCPLWNNMDEDDAHDNEIVMFVEEFPEYINPFYVYSKKHLLEMLGEDKKED